MGEVAKLIREARYNIRLSQAELGERLGIVRQAISEFETGTSLPTPEKARLLLKELEIDSEEFLRAIGRDYAYNYSLKFREPEEALEKD